MAAEDREYLALGGFSDRSIAFCSCEASRRTSIEASPYRPRASRHPARQPYGCRATPVSGPCTSNAARALINGPYSREPLSVGAAKDRPVLLVQRPGSST